MWSVIGLFLLFFIDLVSVLVNESNNEFIDYSIFFFLNLLINN